MRRLIARVRADNEPSLRAFRAAGFIEVGEEQVDDLPARRFELSVG